MRGHNVCFHGEIRKKTSLNYLQYPLLSGALISSVTGLLHYRIMTPNIQEYLPLRGCFEISVFEISRVDFTVYR